MLEQLKNKRYLGAAGLILLFLGTILPYYQYTLLGYHIKLCLNKYIEGKIVMALIIANLLFIFKDYVEKYAPQMFHSNIGMKIKNANPKLAIVPTILIVAFVILLFLRVDLGTTLKHGLGFFTLWLGVICLVLHSFIYKKNKEITTIESEQTNYNQIVNNQQMNSNQQPQTMNNNINSNVKYCGGCGNPCDFNAEKCVMCGRSF